MKVLKIMPPVHLFEHSIFPVLTDCILLHQKTGNTMNDKTTLKALTKKEIEVMNVLWDAQQALTIHEIVAQYPEPQPAYTTIGTFLKILEAKGYVEHHRKEDTGRTFYYSPMLTREKYTVQVLKDVKDSLFGSSAKHFCSFLIQSEELSDEDLNEILSLIHNA